MDSNHPSFDTDAAAQDGAEESRKGQLTKAVVQGILDGAELPLEDIPSFIEEVTNALNQVKRQVADRAESEIARVEAVRAKVCGAVPRTMSKDEPSYSDALDWKEEVVESVHGTLDNAKKVVEHMEEESLKGIRRKDVVTALRMTDVHASQALAFAVKQGWLKLEGQTRGARYFLTGAYREEDYFALKAKA